MVPDKSKKIIVLGGGLFGLTTAVILAEAGYQVTVLEKNYDVLKGASLVNQNRIHYGYHYPRSLDTGRESLDGMEMFKQYFGNCLNDHFVKYYGIAREGSHLNAQQFEGFCKELNIPLEECWPTKDILNYDKIECCWKVYEPVFDYHILRYTLLSRVNENQNIQILRNAEVNDIQRPDRNTFDLKLTNGYKLQGNFIVNATYAGLGDLLNLLYHKPLKSKYQLLILPILYMPDPMEPFGITIMDGPFSSLVPRGFNQSEYILSHVAHSVIDSHLGYEMPQWNVLDGQAEANIVHLSSDFFPILHKMQLKESWITTKMILPEQELDDARPTLFLEHEDNVVSLFSGKVTTCVSAGLKVLDKVNQEVSG